MSNCFRTHFSKSILTNPTKYDVTAGRYFQMCRNFHHSGINCQMNIRLLFNLFPKRHLTSFLNASSSCSRFYIFVFSCSFLTFARAYSLKFSTLFLSNCTFIIRDTLESCPILKTSLVKCWTFHIFKCFWSLFGQGNGILFRDIVSLSS